MIAAAVFLAVAAGFAFVTAGACGYINLTSWLGLCGFKQRHNLPCPACGMTTAAVMLVRGRLMDALRIQPAGVFFCFLAAAGGVLSFLIAVFGVYFDFLNKLFTRTKVKFIVLFFVIAVALGWAATLLRATGVE